MNKQEIIINIFFLIGTILIVISIGFIILKNLNVQIQEFEKSCYRMSMNEFEDNCMCPCGEPNWIERKLNLLLTCDGWIVKKNQSCLYGIEFANG